MTPAISVNAANPTDVRFTVSGLASDYSGTVTFTDATGKTDVVPIGGNGTYSANLSNLANGTLTYLMTVSDPAGNVINVDPTVTLGDGSANAAAGTSQYPSLFTGYAVRPSWQVAGVDYAVGVPSGTVLKNPATISMAGVSVNTSTHVISITGNNVTLDGYDFSLNGGWQVSISGMNATVKDSYFKIGANNLQPITTTGSDNLNSTLIYCEIDGSGKNPGSNTLINNINTIEYCYLHDAGQDVINYGHPLVVEYNLVANNGLIAGAHADWIQLGSGTGWNATVDYNTFYQSGVGNMGTQGIEISGWGTDNFVGQVENNTIIVKPNGNVNNTIGSIGKRSQSRRYGCEQLHRNWDGRFR